MPWTGTYAFDARRQEGPTVRLRRLKFDPDNAYGYAINRVKCHPGFSWPMTSSSAAPLIFLEMWIQLLPSSASSLTFIVSLCGLTRNSSAKDCLHQKNKVFIFNLLLVETLLSNCYLDVHPSTQFLLRICNTLLFCIFFPYCYNPEL